MQNPLSCAWMSSKHIFEGSLYAAAEDNATSVHQKCPLAAELPHIAAPLLPFLALCQDPGSSSQGPPAAQPLQRTDTQISVTQEVQLDADSAAALALPPVLMPRHRTYQLTEKGILEMTGVSLLGMLTQLNLHGSALKRIEVNLECTCLLACARMLVRLKGFTRYA